MKQYQSLLPIIDALAFAEEQRQAPVESAERPKDVVVINAKVGQILAAIRDGSDLNAAIAACEIVESSDRYSVADATFTIYGKTFFRGAKAALEKLGGNSVGAITELLQDIVNYYFEPRAADDDNEQRVELHYARYQFYNRLLGLILARVKVFQESGENLADIPQLLQQLQQNTLLTSAYQGEIAAILADTCDMLDFISSTPAPADPDIPKKLLCLDECAHLFLLAAKHDEDVNLIYVNAERLFNSVRNDADISGLQQQLFRAVNELVERKYKERCAEAVRSIKRLIAVRQQEKGRGTESWRDQQYVYRLFDEFSNAHQLPPRRQRVVEDDAPSESLQRVQRGGVLEAQILQDDFLKNRDLPKLLHITHNLENYHLCCKERYHLRVIRCKEIDAFKLKMSELQGYSGRLLALFSSNATEEESEGEVSDSRVINVPEVDFSGMLKMVAGMLLIKSEIPEPLQIVISYLFGAEWIEELSAYVTWLQRPDEENEKNDKCRTQVRLALLSLQKACENIYTMQMQLSDAPQNMDLTNSNVFKERIEQLALVLIHLCKLRLLSLQSAYTLTPTRGRRWKSDESIETIKTKDFFETNVIAIVWNLSLVLLALRLETALPQEAAAAMRRELRKLLERIKEFMEKGVGGCPTDVEDANKRPSRVLQALVDCENLFGELGTLKRFGLGRCLSDLFYFGSLCIPEFKKEYKLPTVSKPLDTTSWMDVDPVEKKIIPIAEVFDALQGYAMKLNWILNQRLMERANFSEHNRAAAAKNINEDLLKALQQHAVNAGWLVSGNKVQRRGARTPVMRRKLNYAADDAQTLGTHGTNPHYMYSYLDMCILMENLRLGMGQLSESAIKGVFLSNIYVIQGNDTRFFTEHFNAHIKHIVESWRQMPKILVLPVLVGRHYCVIRVEIDYADTSNTSILWSDPFGGEERLEYFNLISASLKDGVQKLIQKSVGREEFVLADDPQIVVKNFDQQGVGSNATDCGVITASNARVYADLDLSNHALVNDIDSYEIHAISGDSAATISTRRAEDQRIFTQSTSPFKVADVGSVRRENIEDSKSTENILSEIVEWNEHDIALFHGAIYVLRLLDSSESNSEYSRQEIVAAYCYVRNISVVAAAAETEELSLEFGKGFLGADSFAEYYAFLYALNEKQEYHALVSLIVVELLTASCSLTEGNEENKQHLMRIMAACWQFKLLCVAEKIDQDKADTDYIQLVNDMVLSPFKQLIAALTANAPEESAYFESLKEEFFYYYHATLAKSCSFSVPPPPASAIRKDGNYAHILMFMKLFAELLGKKVLASASKLDQLLIASNATTEFQGAVSRNPTFVNTNFTDLETVVDVGPARLRQLLEALDLKSLTTMNMETLQSNVDMEGAVSKLKECLGFVDEVESREQFKAAGKKVAAEHGIATLLERNLSSAQRVFYELFADGGLYELWQKKTEMGSDADIASLGNFWVDSKDNAKLMEVLKEWLNKVIQIYSAGHSSDTEDEGEFNDDGLELDATGSEDIDKLVIRTLRQVCELLADIDSKDALAYLSIANFMAFKFSQMDDEEQKNSWGMITAFAGLFKPQSLSGDEDQRKMIFELIALFLKKKFPDSSFGLDGLRFPEPVPAADELGYYIISDRHTRESVYKNDKPEIWQASRDKDNLNAPKAEYESLQEKLAQINTLEITRLNLQLALHEIGVSLPEQEEPDNAELKKAQTVASTRLDEISISGLQSGIRATDLYREALAEFNEGLSDELAVLRRMDSRFGRDADKIVKKIQKLVGDGGELDTADIELEELNDNFLGIKSEEEDSDGEFYAQVDDLPEGWRDSFVGGHKKLQQEKELMREDGQLLLLAANLVKAYIEAGNVIERRKGFVALKKLYSQKREIIDALCSAKQLVAYYKRKIDDFVKEWQAKLKAQYINDFQELAVLIRKFSGLKGAWEGIQNRFSRITKNKFDSLSRGQGIQGEVYTTLDKRRENYTFQEVSELRKLYKDARALVQPQTSRHPAEVFRKEGRSRAYVSSKRPTTVKTHAGKIVGGVAGLALGVVAGVAAAVLIVVGAAGISVGGGVLMALGLLTICGLVGGGLGLAGGAIADSCRRTQEQVSYELQPVVPNSAPLLSRRNSSSGYGTFRDSPTPPSSETESDTDEESSNELHL